MSEVARFQIPPVEKSLLVRCDPARAFHAFTAEIAAWWPLASHSVNDEKAKSLRIEPAVGGRIIETAEDGTECEWGRVLSWSPPSGFSATWHPGWPADPHTIVELSFVAEAGGTRVRLIHRGWEALGERAQRSHDSYNNGWDKVFGQAFGSYMARAR